MSTAAATAPGDALIPVLQPAGWFGAGLALLERPLVRRPPAGGAAELPIPRVTLAWQDEEILMFPQAARLQPTRWGPLQDAALINLRRRHPASWRWRHDGAGHLALGLLEGPYAASYALDRRLLRRAHARFGHARLLLAVPGGDRLLVTTGQAFAAEPFAALVDGLYGLAASPLSRQLFVSVDARLGGPLEIPGRA